MGFALERFAESVDPDFQCRLCGQVLEEPLCTPCGGDRSVRGGCRSAPGIRRGGGGGSRGGSPGVCGRSWRGPGPRVWRRREKALLAQLWELQGEVRLIARRYQEKLTQYMAHVRNFVRDLGGGHDAEGEHKPLTIVLERENDTLGFNIIGGRPNQNNQEETPMEGIYISKILKNGPADRADGLEIHDKIIEIYRISRSYTSEPKSLDMVMK
nr:PREDICTED: PDZ domain-containing RING finger protein 4-like [Bos indicus]